MADSVYGIWRALLTTGIHKCFDLKVLPCWMNNRINDKPHYVIITNGQMRAGVHRFISMLRLNGFWDSGRNHRLYAEY